MGLTLNVTITGLSPGCASSASTANVEVMISPSETTVGPVTETRMIFKVGSPMIDERYFEKAGLVYRSESPKAINQLRHQTVAA